MSSESAQVSALSAETWSDHASFVRFSPLPIEPITVLATTSPEGLAGVHQRHSAPPSACNLSEVGRESRTGSVHLSRGTTSSGNPRRLPWHSSQESRWQFYRLSSWAFHRSQTAILLATGWQYRYQLLAHEGLGNSSVLESHLCQHTPTRGRNPGIDLLEQWDRDRIGHAH